MPRVVPEYKEKARERIVDAAIAEFAKKGYRDTTLNDIAKAIGVSKSAVYQYFDSKEVLIGEVGHKFVGAMLANEISAMNNSHLIETTEEASERVLKSMPNWFLNLLCDFLSEAHRDKKASQQVREIERRLVEAISGFWEERQKAGEVPTDVDSERVARGLVALQMGLITMITTGLPRSEAIKTWREMVKRLGESVERRKP